jgi:hypothetical protein
MNKLLIIITALLITTNSYSKEVNLFCRGTLSIKWDKVEDVSKHELNFSFDDVKDTITIKDNLLMCLNYQTTVDTRQFTKQDISLKRSTRDKLVQDSGYCLESFELNRNSGLLKTTKIVTTIVGVEIYTGNFNCELAKQKF